jgi:hypothetical protein
MKYVRLADKFGLPQFLFGVGTMTHQQIADSHGTAIGAGFYDPETHTAFGHSESLGLRPLPDDGALIARMTEVQLQIGGKR